jgi:membrane dipeptidase
VAHVGLGSDFEGVGDTLPFGLEDTAKYPSTASGLLARGYTNAQVPLVLGENLLRVWSAVERYASAHGHEAQCRSDAAAVAVH